MALGRVAGVVVQLLGLTPFVERASISGTVPMKPLPILCLALLVLIIAIPSPVHAADTIQYRAKPRDGKMSIQGTSNVHDWLVEGIIIGGTAQAGAGFLADLKAAKAGELDFKADVAIPVRSLKSVKDGKPYDARMDEAMYEEMKMADHPQVRYSLTRLILKEAPAGAEEPFRLTSEGQLTVAGVTQTISMPIELRLPDADTLDFRGDVSLLMSDFEIGPVARLGGLFKTGDEVKLSFRWVLGKR
jgi:hypothetical protein